MKRAAKPATSAAGKRHHVRYGRRRTGGTFIRWIRTIILAVLVGIAIWALWPTAEAKSAAPGGRTTLNPGAKYRLRIAPALYMPGTMPFNAGAPLEGFNEVADAFEKRFPDTSIQFVEIPSSQREWLVTQLSAEQAPDILQVNVEDVWQDVQKGWYVPLDAWLEKPNPFVKPGAPGSREWWDLFKYQAITRGKAAPMDGLMYCISYDMVETGIFYNKDIFRRLGLEVPKTWAEFLEIQQKCKDAGYLPLLVAGRDLCDWGVDLTFDQLYYSLHELTDLHTDPKRAAYLSNYLDWDEICFLHHKGFFTPADPRWGETFRILKQWRQYMPQELGTGGIPPDLLRLFITQKGAMYYSASWDVNKLVRDPDVRFGWGVFYLPKLTTQTSRFASNVEQCVIGGSAMQYSVSNTALSDTPRDLPLEQRIARSQRLKRAIAFLQFMTTPENADAVINEPIMFLPNIVGVEPHRQLLPFDEILKRRYTSTKWSYTFDLRFNDIMQRMLILYLNDGIDERGFLRWMTENIDTACDNITRRKQIDLSEFNKTWAARKDLRQTLPGLPPAARPE